MEFTARGPLGTLMPSTKTYGVGRSILLRNARLGPDRLRFDFAMRHLSLPSGPFKLVCLAAHPDDIEIAAGATLLALAERGSVEGHWLTLTGSPDRRAEAEAAAQAFLPNA